MLFAGRTFSADALRGLRRPSHKTQYNSESVTLSRKEDKICWITFGEIFEQISQQFRHSNNEVCTVQPQNKLYFIEIYQDQLLNNHKQFSGQYHSKNEVYGRIEESRGSRIEVVNHPDINISSDRSSDNDDAPVYIHHRNFFSYSSAHFHSLLLKQYQCNWCHSKTLEMALETSLV